MLVCAREVGAGPLPIADNMAESLNDCLNDAIVTRRPVPMGMFEMVFWWRRDARRGARTAALKLVAVTTDESVGFPLPNVLDTSEED